MMSPPPPGSPSPRNPLSSDDLIGIFVAFLTIGAILFWSIGRKGGDVNLALQNSPATPQPKAFQFPRVLQERPIVKSRAVEGDPLSSPAPEASGRASLQPVYIPGAGVGFYPDSRDVQPGYVFVPTPNRIPYGTPVVPTPAIATPPVAAGTSVVSPSPQGISFTDVSNDYWAFPFIAALSQRGIISGFSDGSFHPDEPVNRAQFASMLSEAFAQTQEQRPVPKFEDVSSSFWAAPVIGKAYRIGFMEGYPHNVFQPTQQIPRFQALIALSKGLNLNIPPNTSGILQTYQDANQLPAYAIDRIASATEAGLVVNYPNSTTLAPTKVATRAEVAAFIYQALVQSGQAERIDSPYIVQP